MLRASLGPPALRRELRFHDIAEPEVRASSVLDGQSGARKSRLVPVSRKRKGKQMKIAHWGFGSVGVAVLVLAWGCSSQLDGSQVASRTTESASFDFGDAVVDVNRTDTGVVASVVDRAGTLLLRTEVTPTAWTTDVPGANVHRVSGTVDAEHGGLQSWAEYAYNA